MQSCFRACGWWFKGNEWFYRILKPKDGESLVPIDTKLNKTFEDSNIIDPKEREKHYGQRIM